MTSPEDVLVNVVASELSVVLKSALAFGSTSTKIPGFQRKMNAFQRDLELHPPKIMKPAAGMAPSGR